MPLLEDLQDIFAPVRTIPERTMPSVWFTPFDYDRVGLMDIPHEQIRQVLAVKAHYTVEDSGQFIETFKTAALFAPDGTRLRMQPGGPLGLVEPLFLCVLIEAGLHPELMEHLQVHGRELGHHAILVVREMVQTHLEFFPRDLLVSLQDLGVQMAPLAPADFRLSWQLLAVAAARARGRAVSLRLSMAEVPEIAEHGDEVLAYLERRGMAGGLRETIQQANAPLARPATSVEYATSLDRSRAYLEQVLRIVLTLRQGAEADLQRFASLTGSRLVRTLGGFVSPNEGGLLSSFLDFVSTQGAHQITATLEQARIARNLAIELSWYLLKRLQRSSSTQ